MSIDRPTEGARRGLAGRVLGGRYRVTRMVSAGASTLIADAEDQELGRPVTVKLVRPELAESEEFRHRFARTMKVVSKLSHPNLAAVHDWGEEEVGRRTTVYAVGEHLSGGSLRDLFDRGRQLDPSQALVVGLEVCRGLDYAHRKSLVHGELTPAKLVFGDDRRLRIVDFGLARLLTADEWREPSSVPTHVARYCSPEQALGQPIDGRTDVYSLALILVEAVTGTVPFAARSTVATLSARVGRLMPASADLGPLASVLERAGRPDPADRSSAAELGRNLVRAAEKLPRPAPIPILVTRPFDEDPSQLRRPNDPTGGLARPEPEPTAPLVPPVEVPPADVAPEEPATAPAEPVEAVEADVPEVSAADVAAADADAAPGDPVEPTVTATPEEHAAAAAIGGAVIATAADGAADVVAAAEHPGEQVDGHAADVAPQSPLPPPVPPSTRLYDGDEDLTKDELARLAQLPVEPETFGPSAPTVPDSPGVPPPTDVIPTREAPAAAMPARRRRRWLPWVLAAVVVVALGGLGLVAYNLFKVPKHPVPELVGLTEQDARQQTASFDWDLDVRHERSDEHPDAGEIIRTAPVAGEQLAENEPFLIVVSDGPEFRTLADLTGMTQAEAETKLAQLELAPATPVQQNDESVPVGSVISWSVPADTSLTTGGQVLPGTVVQLVISTGPAPRTIPTLVGLTVDQATQALQGIQLGVTVGEPVFSDTVPAGSVVSANPPDGTTGIARGTVVALTPSKGVDLVTMPDLTGQTLPQAQASLAAAGLQTGALLGDTQGIFVSATVQGQAAPAGAQFKRGSAVDMTFLPPA
jgi:beta-lactam-binding protein with PASTA domain